MKIAVGSDHAGFELKNKIIKFLQKEHQVKDFGCFSSDSVDYPDFAKVVARKVAAKEFDRGILICGTGIGMCITANRFKGVRAALCYNLEIAKLSRQHNDGNILCLGARTLNPQQALGMVKVWLSTPFEGGRHLRRIKKIDALT